MVEIQDLPSPRIEGPSIFVQISIKMNSSEGSKHLPPLGNGIACKIKEQICEKS